GVPAGIVVGSPWALRTNRSTFSVVPGVSVGTVPGLRTAVEPPGNVAMIGPQIWLAARSPIMFGAKLSDASVPASPAWANASGAASTAPCAPVSAPSMPGCAAPGASPGVGAVGAPPGGVTPGAVTPGGVAPGGVTPGGTAPGWGTGTWGYGHGGWPRKGFGQ